MSKGKIVRVWVVETMTYASCARQSQAKIVHRFILFTRFILILPGKYFLVKHTCTPHWLVLASEWPSSLTNDGAQYFAECQMTEF